jgi:hypothetical protein
LPATLRDIPIASDAAVRGNSGTPRPRNFDFQKNGLHPGDKKHYDRQRVLLSIIFACGLCDGSAAKRDTNLDFLASDAADC